MGRGGRRWAEHWDSAGDVSEQSHPGLLTGDTGYQAEHTRSEDVAFVTAEGLGESGNLNLAVRWSRRG